MKKILAFILAAIMMLSFAACGNDEPAAENTEENTEENVTEVTVGSALEILETVWAAFGDNEKFPVMGGDYDALVDGAPGVVASTDFMVGNLYIPEAEAAKVTEAASLMHGMMANSFTCGAYKVDDSAAFAEAMYEAYSNTQWLCGVPEKMLIATVGDNYVVAMFGANDALNPFEEKLVAAYPGAEVVHSEAIAG